MEYNAKALEKMECTPRNCWDLLMLCRNETQEAKEDLHRLAIVDWPKFFETHSSESQRNSQTTSIGDILNTCCRISQPTWGGYEGLSTRPTLAPDSGVPTLFSQLSRESYRPHRGLLDRSSNIPSAAQRYLFYHNLRAMLKARARGERYLHGAMVKDSGVSEDLQGTAKYRQRAVDCFDNSLSNNYFQGVRWNAYASKSKATNTFAMLCCHDSHMRAPVTGGYSSFVDSKRINGVDIGGKWMGLNLSCNKVDEHSGNDQDIEVYESCMVHTEQAWVYNNTNQGRYVEANVLPDRSLELESRIPAQLGDGLDLSDSCLTLEGTDLNKILHWDLGSGVKKVSSMNAVFNTRNLLLSPMQLRKIKRPMVVIDKRFIAKWTSDSDEVTTCTGTSVNRAVSVMKRRTRSAIMDALDF